MKENILVFLCTAQIIMGANVLCLREHWQIANLLDLL